MSQYWTFGVSRVARCMAYASKLAETERMEDAKRVIEFYRKTTELRPLRPMPL
jgi:hypothetical protein